jgi:hypothetical protein
MFQENIKHIRLKLETVDTKIIKIINEKQDKTAVHQSYFNSLGQMSVIKCGTKNISMSHIFDYFALGLIK